MPVRPTADIFVEALSPYLGPHTSKTAVRTFSQRALNKEAEALTKIDAPRLIDALRPTLGALLGAAKSEELVEQLNLQLKGLS